MAQDLIYKKLRNSADCVKTKFKPKNTFAVFYYNRAKILALIIPTFNKLCLDSYYINTVISNIKVLDIRYIITEENEEIKNEIIEALFSGYYYINPKYEHIYLNSFLAKEEDFKQNNTKVIIESVLKLIKTACHYNSNTTKFIKQLNDVEKTTIERIVAEIGYEGVISQCKVASAAGISRAAMTHLMLKMSVSGVAEITYMGKKGTHIKILDDSLMNIRG